MTSRKGVATIVATCKQTRFHFAEDSGSADIDIKGVDLVVKSAPEADPSSQAASSATKLKTKGKTKGKTEGTEILLNADLRLKEGVHYGFIGRNGTGKSTILRAVAEKLIPGLSDSLKVSILQQRDDFDGPAPAVPLKPKSGLGDHEQTAGAGKTVLQTVLQSDWSRNDLSRRLKALSQAFEEQERDSLAPVRVFRQLQHEQLQHELFLARKNASLRSGTRGMQARKDLKACESKVSESEARVDEDLNEVDRTKVGEETREALELLNELQTQFDALQISDVEQEARRVLKGLGFKEPQLEQPFESLSGGWRMRCMLAGVLTQTADIMILDEPTNFLDLLGVIWLETYLKQLREDSTKTVVLVSHDRAFLDAICEEIVILKDQTLEYFRGNVSAYEADLKSKRLYWGRMKEAQDHQKSHMEATIRENIKLGKKTGDDNKLAMAKSRQKKMDERMGVQVNANGGRFKLNRDHAGWHDSLRAEIEVPPEERGVSMVIPDAPELRFPGSLISAESLSFRYCPKDAPVLDSVDLVIHMGDRVGLMGLNGCGKTTLLRLLTGSLDSPQGKVARHSRLKLGYYSQHSVEDLHKMGQSEAGLTALTLIRRDTEGALDEGEARGLLGSLGLPGRTASDVPVAQLSGGQLVRLALARILWKTPHLLILDEVTTHLDFHTVRGLAVALSSFNGAILLVSHDRYLVRSVVEGKKDADPAAAESADAELEIAEEEPEDSARRRSVYVLRSGKLHLQATGVADFEASLEKRVRKMMREA